MPGPAGASTSKPPSNSRVAGSTAQHSKPSSGVKRARMQSVSEDDRIPQPSRTTKPSAGKGKGRAVDEEEREEEDEVEEADVQQEIARNTKEANESSRVNGRGGDSIVSLQRQLRDLKSKLSEAEKSRDTYQTQLQKLHQLRHTDPEKNLQDMEKIWEQRGKVQEDQIVELRRYAGLLSKDDDAPQKKVATLEGENTRLKAELGRARQLLNDADRAQRRELELEDEVKQLKEELRLMIASQTSRPTSSKTVPNSKTDISIAKIMKLYEDMTNIHITGYKAEQAEHGLTDNDVFSCIVSVDERSVGFKLKVHFNSSGEQLSPGKSTAFEPLVSYTPTTLEQETDQDLLDSLDFLTESFDFQPSQMDTFLRTLVDRVKGV